MKSIYKPDEVEKLIEVWKKLNFKIVLAGGCFDILHIGHVDFLQKAKRTGDKLLILLESDNNIRKSKGKNRPINKQSNRAKILSALKPVDAIIKLSEMKSDQDYDQMVKSIRPDIIVVTEGDVQLTNKKRQADSVGAKIVVIPKLKQVSTSKIIKYLRIKTDKIKN